MRPPAQRPRSGATGFGLALLLLATTASGQATPGDASPLARFVPRDNLVAYFEYDGLDAHADAWHKTAAYKILTTTTTGAMLEDLFVQLVGKLPATKLTGPEALALLKHAARSGFVFAIGGDIRKDKPDFGVFAFRDAFKNKEVRPLFARWLQGLNAPNTRSQAVVRAGHKVIVGNTGTAAFTWWVEEKQKADLVLVFPNPESADFILETLEGKRPSAVEHPRRVELAAPEGGFLPTGLAFVDPVLLRNPRIPVAVGLSEVMKMDYRWGFQDDALMTVARLSSPSPRKGLLSLLDGPTFDKATLPPLPESLTGYTVASVDLKTTLDKLVTLASPFRPDAQEQVNHAIEAIKTKTKLRLREDILAHLGPKVAWYVLPGKAAPAAPATPNMMSMMMTAAGLDQIPKLAIVFDLDNPSAFGKVLDELMAFANREIKAQAAKQVGGDAAPARGARNRGGGPPTPEFRLMPGENKTYVLSPPPEMASMIPATLRPTIRVGPKNLVIAISPEVARQALEAKGAWTPPTQLAGTFLGLSPKLKMLSVEDPRDTTPAILASLPARLQKAINSAILKSQPPPQGGVAPGAGSGTQPGPPTGPTGIRSPLTTEATASAGPGAGSAGGPGNTAAAGTAAANKPMDGPSTVTLQVDAAKLPSADAIRGLLFPSVTSAEVTDEGLRIVVRRAFPTLGDPVQSGMISGILTSAMGRAGIPTGLPPAPGPVGGAPGTTPIPGVRPQ